MHPHGIIMITIFTQINTVVLIIFFTSQGQRLFEDGVYLKNPTKNYINYGFISVLY